MVIGYYKENDINEMASKFRELKAKHNSLQERISLHLFSTPKGEEFAKHGYLRRSDMLWRCVQKTFETIPLTLSEMPTRDHTKDVTIFLHCFMIHVFGACDDLAWILVHEKDITKPDGGELPRNWVGFRKANKLVRNELSANMITVLDGLEDWFEHVDEFRHSLAHRIPLYVPQYYIRHDREDDYRRLERESFEALKRGDLAEHQRLELEQIDLTFFRPWFVHSLSECSPTVVIHPQMLADFGAVLELGEATLQGKRCCAPIFRD